MNLFRLSQDKRIVGAPEPLTDTETIKKLLQPKYDQFGRQERILIPPLLVRSAAPVLFLDILQIPFTLVSKPIKSILERYDSEILFHSVSFIDQNHGKQAAYWLMEAPVVDCLSEESERDWDGTVKRIVLDEEKAKRSPVFQVKGMPEDVVIIHLPVAESLMRRDVFGIHIQKIQTTGGKIIVT